MSWQTKALSEVAYTAGRIGWKGLTAKEYTESGPYFLSVHSLNYGDFVDFRDAFHISDDRYEESPEIMLQPDDILICKDGAGIGKTGIIKSIPGPTTINSSLLLIRALEDVVPKFLYYKLCSPSFQRIVQERIEGATTPHLYQREIKLFSISFPSIPEQKRIVALLDTVFADLEQTSAKTEQNLKNARELFDSYLQQVFSQKGEGWTTNKLKAITSKIGSGATPRGGKAAYKTEGMSLIRSMNVHDRQFKKKNLALIDDEQAARLSNVEIKRNDVLLNITGASVARCCVVPDEYLPARVNQHVSIIRVNDNTIKPELLCYLLTSKYYKDILLGIGEAGSTRQAITKVQIQNFEVSYPESLSNQDVFIQRLTALENDILKLNAIYTKKLNALDVLKKSILQKAFSGELTHD